MKRILLLFVLLYFSAEGVSQSKLFKITLSNDTIYENNFAIVEFKIFNSLGEFVEPGFSDFEVLDGPKTSFYYTVRRGKQTKVTSHVYYIKPKKEGNLIIESAQLLNSDGILKTEQKSVFVLPKPQNLAVENTLNKNRLKVSIPRNDLEGRNNP